MAKESKDSKPLLLRLITGKLRKETPTVDQSKKYVFILSTGRTGTKYIASYLAGYKNVYSVHEPKPSWRLRMWTMAKLENKINDDYLYKIFVKIRGKRLATVNEDVYVESNPALSGFAVALAKNMPNVYIVHIVRDPRERVTSSINNGALRTKKRLMISLMPYWHLRPLKLVDQKSSTIKKIAKLWPLINNHLKAASSYTDKYTCIRFEDLFSDPSKMEELVNFIGIEKKDLIREKDNSAKTNKNASRYNDIEPWQNWSPYFAMEINSIIGSGTMRDYGYGQEEEWKAKITYEQ